MFSTLILFFLCFLFFFYFFNFLSQGFDLDVGAILNIDYREVTPEQIEALKSRSTQCVQTISFSQCAGATVDISKIFFLCSNMIVTLLSIKDKEIV